MIDVRPHKTWIAALIAAALIAAASTPLFGLAQRKAAIKLTTLRKETAKTNEALRQINEDKIAIENMKNKIDVNAAKKYLRPVDRLRAAQILEDRAAESRLTGLSYTLSPEQKTDINTPGAGKQALARAQWTIAADAPADTDAFAFLDSLGRALPGRIELREMNLRRLGGKDSQISEANVRLTASGEWLSNGAHKGTEER